MFLTSLSSAASPSHATGLSAGLVRAVFNGRVAAGMTKKGSRGGRPNIATWKRTHLGVLLICPLIIVMFDIKLDGWTENVIHSVAYF